MVIWNLKIFVELLAYLYCLAELFGQKFRINIYVVVLVIMDLFLWTGLENYRFSDYLVLLDYIAIFLYGLLSYKESVKNTLINCFLAAIIVSILQLFLLFPLYYLFFINYGQGVLHELLINTGCLLLIMLISRKIKLKNLSDFLVKRNKLIIGVSTLVFCGLGISIYQMINEARIFGVEYIQIVYFILIFLFTIYEWQKTRMDAEKKRTQLEMNRLYYDAYDQLLLLIRERQHDMKNHINAILSMIHTTDSFEELTVKQKEYCAYVMGQNEGVRLVLSAENPLIAGFVYSKIQEAERSGIKVDYQIRMQKNASIVPEYELVEIIGILLDNAIEALSSEVENLNGENKYRKICLSIKETENDIELAVANTSKNYEEDMTKRFFEAGYSSKGRGRGIGLSKLKRIVREQQGKIVVSNELREGINYLTFVINLTKEKRQKF